MKAKTVVLIIALFAYASTFGNDTLYFRLANPWNTVKSSTGNYLRKCVKEKDYYHAWDYNNNQTLVVEGFYADTSFTRKLFCHKYFDEMGGFLRQTRCYENGRLNGYFVDYNQNGGTTAYQVYENGDLLKEWSSEPKDNSKILNLVEVEAAFPGGPSAWRNYLSSNLRYPKSLKQGEVSGKVIAKIHLDATGQSVTWKSSKACIHCLMKKL